MSKWIKPFSDNNNEEYNYFSIENITENLKITKKVYNEALKLVADQKAVLENAEFGYMDHTYDNQMAAFFSVKIIGVCNVDAYLKKNSIIDFDCDNRKCPSTFNNEICVHKTAALILIQKYLKDHRPGDITDKNAAIFLHSFRINNISNNNQKASVHIIPRIFHMNDSLLMKILVSKTDLKKYYIVQNITDFFYTEQDQEVYKLGKNNEIDFSSETFVPECFEFVQLLKGWIHDKHCRSSFGYYFSANEENDMKKYVKLYGDRIDQLYDIFDGQKIEYNAKKVEMLNFKTYNPEINLKIEKIVDDGQFEGVFVSGELPLIFYGNKYYYCINNNDFCRMDQEYSGKIEPLYLLCNINDRDIYFQIGRKNLAEFYYTVLPVLRKIA